MLRQEYVVETICKDLEREGYSVQPLLIPACAVGAPHRRDRVWFVAHRNDAPRSDLDRCRNGKNKQEPLTQCKGTSNNCFSSKDGVVTYSYCELPSQRMLQGEKGRYKQKIPTESLHIQSNWENFPTQSPVCRGNDGLPFDVDNLTIPFTKWRQESIKGYGNAIVPHVIIEIFKAIEELDN